MAEAKEVKCEVIKVFDERETRRGKIRLQVIRWGTYSPVLEKREYWINEENEERTGKAKGLNGDDIRLLSDHFDEIEKLLG